MAPSQVTRRYLCVYDDCGAISANDYYVRWAIVAAVAGIIVLILLLGYLHAVRRLKRGQQPLAYHRWLVRRNRYPAPAGGQTTYAYYMQPPQGQQAYPMHGYQAGPPPQQGQQTWAPPPPAYGQHVWDTPPVYGPPAGATKAAANQNVEGMNNSANGEGSSGLAAPQHTYQAPPRNDHTQ